MNPNDKRILVREKALQNWRVPGAEKQVRPLTDDLEYESLILIKLEEESEEVVQQCIDDPYDTEKLTEELGDLLSVMRSVARHYEIPWENVEAQCQKKNDSHGTFNYPNALVWDRS